MSFNKVMSKILFAVALLGSLIHIVNSLTGVLPAFQMRPLHLVLAGLLVFAADFMAPKIEKNEGMDLVDPHTILKTVYRVLDVVMFAFMTLGCGYFAINYSLIASKAGYVTPELVIYGSMLVLAVLYMTWRKVGAALAIIALICIAYCLFGAYMPGALGHKGYSFGRTISFLYTNGNGIFGVPIDTSARHLVLFMVFGQFIDRSGTSRLFMILANKMARATRGGAAKSSVVASALFGTISGTPIANVMVTGAFTIPMMKKTGFEPNFAAGVEATASTGGLIMPPMMGAGAFVMAELMGLGYESIMVAAAIPAILYYISLFLAVDFYSANRGISRVTDAPDPNEPKIRDYIHTIIPLFVFLVMIYAGMTVSRSVVVAIVLTPIVCLFRKHTRMKFKEIVGCIADGMKSVTTMCAACAGAGIIVGGITLSGFGFSFSDLLRMFSDMPLVALIITMMVCIIMGMGMPAVASYLITATIAVPTLVELGFQPLATHMFIFYFSAFSVVTPPVALASYTAAGLANTNPMTTGFKAFKLALVAFLVPYFFIYSPALLAQGTAMEILSVIPSALLGTFVFVCGVQGYLFGSMQSFLFRVPMMLAGCLMMIPGWQTDLIGFAMALAIFLAVSMMRKRAKSVAR